VKPSPENSRQPNSGDPLDRLLQQARWSEPREAAEARLTQHWRQAWLARQRRAMLLRRAAGLAIAASLLLAAIVGWRQLHPADKPLAQTDRNNDAVVTSDDGIAPRSPVVAMPPGPPAKQPFMTSAQRRRAALEKEQAIVRAAVERLAADPKLNPVETATALAQETPRSGRHLVVLLRTGNDAEQTTAIRLLTALGDPAAVPALVQAAAVPALHKTAIASLAQLADSATVAELASREASGDLQRMLLATLLSRGDARSFQYYLSFVQDDGLGEIALAAADLVKTPPMEMLFATLESTLETQRIAAAHVIGRIDGPAATRRLIEMIDQGISRQEACVALLSSRGEEAARYVSLAQRNASLAPLFQAASLFATKNPHPRS